MIRKLLIVIVVLGFIACNNEVKQEISETTTKDETVEKKTAKPEKEIAEEETRINEKPAQVKETLVLISTSMGDITAKLYNETPQHRDNFIKLIKEGWYNDSPFHRVINQFMIQGGHNKDGSMDPGYTVPAEFNQALYHKKGALSAARLADQVNPNKESSGCQFYIVQGKKATAQEIEMMQKRLKITYSDEQKDTYMNMGGTPFLDMQYTVFGEVIKGLDIIDKIAIVKTGEGDVPVKALTMTISIIK